MHVRPIAFPAPVRRSMLWAVLRSRLFDVLPTLIVGLLGYALLASDFASEPSAEAGDPKQTAIDEPAPPPVPERILMRGFHLPELAKVRLETYAASARALPKKPNAAPNVTTPPPDVPHLLTRGLRMPSEIRAELRAIAATRPPPETAPAVAVVETAPPAAAPVAAPEPVVEADPEPAAAPPPEPEKPAVAARAPSEPESKLEPDPGPTPEPIAAQKPPPAAPPPPAPPPAPTPAPVVAKVAPAPPPPPAPTPVEVAPPPPPPPAPPPPPPAPTFTSSSLASERLSPPPAKQIDRPKRPTPMSAEQATRELAGAWERVTGEAASPELLSVLWAQWALETGRGRWMVDYNYAGLKGRAPDGGTGYWWTWEETKTIPRRVRAKFRSYETAEHGALDYVSMLWVRYPRAITAARRGDAISFVLELDNGGFFTERPQHYVRSVASLAQEFRRERMHQGI